MQDIDVHMYMPNLVSLARIVSEIYELNKGQTDMAISSRLLMM